MGIYLNFFSCFFSVPFLCFLITLYLLLSMFFSSCFGLLFSFCYIFNFVFPYDFVSLVKLSLLAGSFLILETPENCRYLIWIFRNFAESLQDLRKILVA